MTGVTWGICLASGDPDRCRRTGRVIALGEARQRSFFRNADEIFSGISRVQMLIGQVLLWACDLLVDTVPEAELRRFVDSIRGTVHACVDAMPPHQALSDCKAAPPDERNGGFWPRSRR